MKLPSFITHPSLIHYPSSSSSSPTPCHHSCLNLVKVARKKTSEHCVRMAMERNKAFACFRECFGFSHVFVVGFEESHSESSWIQNFMQDLLMTFTVFFWPGQTFLCPCPAFVSIRGVPNNIVGPSPGDPRFAAKLTWSWSSAGPCSVI